MELGWDRKGWLTLVGIYNVIMKGDRAGQNQTVGNGAKSIPRKMVTPSQLRSRWSRRVRSG